MTTGQWQKWTRHMYKWKRKGSKGGVEVGFECEISRRAWRCGRGDDGVVLERGGG